MRHVPGIDVWRGLSVLLVITHHVAIRLPLKATPLADQLPARLLLAISWNGYEAVLIFFVISGFLITARTLDRDGRPADIDLRAFWTRRLARIAPPLLLLVGVLSVLHALGVPDYTIDPERQTLGLAVLSALTFWLNVYEGRTGYLPGSWDVLWSLSIEELFYLGFPLLFRVARREVVVAAALVPFAALIPLWHAMGEGEIWREKATLPGMAAIATGVVAAMAARRLPQSPQRDRALVVVGSALVVSVLGWGDLWWARIGEGTLLVHVVGVAL
ncbi:MAG: acyltransferase, partial [Alphaproteobacteria bacterium]|nr:acyltransferase [Alphaproteobacteria bacterium]